MTINRSSGDSSCSGGSSGTSKHSANGSVKRVSCCVSRGLFFGSFLVLLGVLLLSFFVALPVLLQMVIYTLPILFIGSHLSLRQAEVDDATGERINRAETINRTDAVLFPVFGSVALFSLYLAYTFLDASWVNFLFTTYLSAIGLVAFADILITVLRPLCPLWLSNESRFSLTFRIPFANKFCCSSSCAAAAHSPEIQSEDQKSKPVGLQEDSSNETVLSDTAPTAATDSEHANGGHTFNFSWLQIFCYLAAVCLCGFWLTTKNWMLHNVLAISFCIQAIGLVSVCNFTVASILLIGLFVYDIFWVFGTDVMVTVAKSFEGPAKLIFPVSLDPWRQSILGLGDVVIPGVFISMCLRFDHWLAHHRTNTGNGRGQKMTDTDIDIHQRFDKFYFWVVLVSYELGLLTTGMVMLIFQHAQPALLYLVPYCLLSLIGAAALKGQVKLVLAYKEDNEQANEEKKSQ